MVLHDFHPPAWLANPHVQSVAGSLPRLGSPAPAFEPLRIDLPEGGALLAQASWVDAAPRSTVLLVHGVGGSSDSRYMVRSARDCVARGLHAVRLNLRGAGDGAEHGRSLYHAGLTGDIEHAVRRLAGDARVESLFLLGFSLGGSALLKLAGEWGDAPPAAVRALASFSAPTQLDAVSRALERGAALPYRRYILRALVAQAMAFGQRHPGDLPFDRTELRRATTIRDYDRQIVVPMHGFRDVRHYYESASAGPFLPRIRLPTMMLHAEDDPIVPSETVAPSVRGLGPAIAVTWTARGGHVGWHASLRETAPTWAMARALRFFDDHRAGWAPRAG
jgi:predicted alpha/beta-fold hydrolase